MRWTNVSDGIPLVSDEILGRSEEVLCQISDGQTFIGYVRHDMDGEFDPCWIQSGRDMYNLDNIVRWIPLNEVVECIE